MDVAGIGSEDDGIGEATNDATVFDEGEASNEVSSQAQNGDERGRDGAGAVEGGRNDANEDDSEVTMLSPPTICLDRDCQRRCDNCAFNLIMIILLRITLIYEIRSHNIKGICSPFKQSKSHTRAPSAEMRVSRGNCCILKLCQ